MAVLLPAVRMPSRREQVGNRGGHNRSNSVEALAGCLVFPLGADRDGELVGDLPKGHRPCGLPPVGAELLPGQVEPAKAKQERRGQGLRDAELVVPGDPQHTGQTGQG